jgi:hypothetical protein
MSQMTLHPGTFDYLKPTEAQLEVMNEIRATNEGYARILERLLPDGPDKTFILRAFRTIAMWTMVAITRQADGSPRQDP